MPARCPRQVTRLVVGLSKDFLRANLLWFPQYTRSLSRSLSRALGFDRSAIAICTPDKYLNISNEFCVPLLTILRSALVFWNCQFLSVSLFVCVSYTCPNSQLAAKVSRGMQFAITSQGGGPACAAFVIRRRNNNSNSNCDVDSDLFQYANCC